MKITILQRGGTKGLKRDIYHEFITHATNYYASRLLSTRMSNLLSLRLELRASKLKKSTRGTCDVTTNGSKATRDFKVVIQRDLELGTLITTLAHEMVHVAQIAYGKLRAKDVRGEARMYWNGEDMTEVPYADRPWEKEAFEQQYDLANDFLAWFKDAELKKAA